MLQKDLQPDAGQYQAAGDLGKFAQQVADRVIFMDGGGIVEEGPPQQIFSSPRSERTIRFLNMVRQKDL